MAQNSSNQDFTNSADGFILGGGTTERKLTVTGSNITLTGSGSNVYTFPAATDTLVGRASTDTLTNKTLTSPVISSIVNTGTLTLPTSTDTLVGRATTDTLTNKTITSTTNSVSSATLTNPYKFSAYLSGATSTVAATLAPVVFQTKTFDTGNNYSTSTGKFTAPVSGYYYASCNTGTSGTTSSNRFFMQFYINGVGSIRGTDTAVTTTVNSSHGGGILYLNANDYLQVYVYCDISLALNTGTNDYFDCHLISTT